MIISTKIKTNIKYDPQGDLLKYLRITNHI